MKQAQQQQQQASSKRKKPGCALGQQVLQYADSCW
jgi:hypothetical protein